MLRPSSNFVRHDAVPRERVLAAAGDWLSSLLGQRPEIVNVGYFGSYSRGNYAPGSDFDVLMEVAASRKAFRDRPFEYLPEKFPVDVDLLVYTSQELAELRAKKAALVAAIDRDFRLLPSSGGEPA